MLIHQCILTITATYPSPAYSTTMHSRQVCSGKQDKKIIFDIVKILLTPPVFFDIYETLFISQKVPNVMFIKFKLNQKVPSKTFFCIGPVGDFMHIDFSLNTFQIFFAYFLAQNCQMYNFDGTKKSTFRMS